jgi:hypothetical protein
MLSKNFVEYVSWQSVRQRRHWFNNESLCWRVGKHCARITHQCHQCNRRIHVGEEEQQLQTEEHRLKVCRPTCENKSGRTVVCQCRTNPQTHCWRTVVSPCRMRKTDADTANNILQDPPWCAQSTDRMLEH